MSDETAATASDAAISGDPFAAAMASMDEAPADEPEALEGDPVEPEADPAEAAPEGEETPDEPKAEMHRVTVDGEEFEVSTDELKNGYMRQRAFTKKTQEIATERKAVAAEKAAVTQEKAKVRGWFKSLVAADATPARVVSQLERAGVPMKRIIAEYADMMAAELDMPEPERIKRERERWEAEKRADQQRRQMTEQQQQHAQQVDKLRKTFSTWLPQAITEAKLPQSKFVKERVSMHLRPLWESGKQLDYSDFKQAADLARAEWLEERAGLAPDDLAEELSDEEKRRALALALQKKNGAKKPPPVVRSGARPATKQAAKPAGPMSMADEMTWIRSMGR